MKKYSKELSTGSNKAHGKKSKIMLSVAASVLSVLTVAQSAAFAVQSVGDKALKTGVGTVASGKNQQEKSFISRNKWKILGAGAVGVVSSAIVWAVKSHSDSSPCGGHSPAPARTSPESAEFLSKNREELLDMLYEYWNRYYMALDNADISNKMSPRERKNIIMAAISAAGDAWYEAGRFANSEAIKNGSYDMGSVSEHAMRVAWLNAWKSNGVAYRMAESKGREFVLNLLVTLKGQINALEDCVNTSKKDRDKPAENHDDPTPNGSSSEKPKNAPQQHSVNYNEIEGLSPEEFDKATKKLSKEQLMDMLPEAYEKFLTIYYSSLNTFKADSLSGDLMFHDMRLSNIELPSAYMIAHADVFKAASAYEGEMYAGEFASKDLDASCNGGYHDVTSVAHRIDAWRKPNGTAYKVFEKNDRDYCLNFLKVVEKHTNILKEKFNAYKERVNVLKRERETKERETRERETKERETRERETRERETRERETRERETREREADTQKCASELLKEWSHFYDRMGNARYQTMWGGLGNVTETAYATVRAAIDPAILKVADDFAKSTGNDDEKSFAYRTRWFNAWAQDGAAYNEIKNKPKEYILNLKRVLQEQGDKLQSRIHVFQFGYGGISSKEFANIIQELPKEQLLESILPGAWKKFLSTKRDFEHYRCTPRTGNQIDIARARDKSLFLSKVIESVRAAVGTDVYDAVKDEDEWESGRSRAYKLIEKNDHEYFENLLLVLKKQEELLIQAL